jgi:hypothetical protein
VKVFGAQSKSQVAAFNVELGHFYTTQLREFCCASQPLMMGLALECIHHLFRMLVIWLVRAA